MGEFASKGVAGAGLGTGIAGLALGVLNGGWLNGNRYGWGGWNNGYSCGCGDSMWNGTAGFRDIQVSEALAQRDMEIARLNAKAYSDESDLAVYKYFDGQIKELNNRFHEFELKQCEFNSVTNSSLSVIAGQVKTQGDLLASITRTAVPSSAICDFNSCSNCQRTTSTM